MAELPIFPVKTDALLADTSHMSAEEFGAYCRLLFVMWRHGGRLPDNPAELARMTGVSRQKWQRISETVLRPMTRAGGQISQKRLTATWLDIQELRKKRALAAEQRWRGRGNANGYASALQVQSKWNANQNQISKLPSVSVDRGAAEEGEER